ncbi:MAG TPA: FAD-dependent oxidoreductase [Thermomonospora sp.]|nr:FAD-dependent oxidoreductase [Thermomonospora sp.]
MAHHIVVAGAGYGGLAAARRVAGRLRSHDVRVTLVNANDRFVERVRLHQLATGQRLRDIPLRRVLDGTGADLVVGHITAIDPAARVIRLGTPPYEIGYDTLVYALGSLADVGTVPGVADHAFPVARADDATRLRARLDELADGAPIAIVGGGLTGVETVAEVAETRTDLRVHLLTEGAAGGWLSDRARRYLHKALSRLNVTVHEHTAVAKVGAGELLTKDGEHLPFDAVVWAAGFQVPALAAEAGLTVDVHGRLVVDATLRSVSHPEVYGVGDAAAALMPDGAVTRMSCQAAIPMGVQAADIIAARVEGREPKPFGLRYVMRNISLGRRDGIIQFTHSDDSPRDIVLTGRTAAIVKEVITSNAVRSLRHPNLVKVLGLDRGR